MPGFNIQTSLCWNDLRVVGAHFGLGCGIRCMISPEAELVRVLGVALVVEVMPMSGTHPMEELGGNSRRRYPDVRKVSTRKWEYFEKPLWWLEPLIRLGGRDPRYPPPPEGPRKRTNETAQAPGTAQQTRCRPHILGTPGALLPGNRRKERDHYHADPLGYQPFPLHLGNWCLGLSSLTVYSVYGPFSRIRKQAVLCNGGPKLSLVGRPQSQKPLSTKETYAMGLLCSLCHHPTSGGPIQKGLPACAGSAWFL